MPSHKFGVAAVPYYFGGSLYARNPPFPPVRNLAAQAASSLPTAVRLTYELWCAAHATTRLWARRVPLRQAGLQPSLPQAGLGSESRVWHSGAPCLATGGDEQYLCNRRERVRAVVAMFCCCQSVVDCALLLVCITHAHLCLAFVSTA